MTAPLLLDVHGVGYELSLPMSSFYKLPATGEEVTLHTQLLIRDDGHHLFGFASKKYHPIDDLDATAWKALNMRTRYYTTKLHIGAFYLPAFLEEMLREVEEH